MSPLLFARDSSPLSAVPEDEDAIMDVRATPPLPHLFSMKLWIALLFPSSASQNNDAPSVLITHNSSALITLPPSSIVVEQAMNVDDKVSPSSLNKLKSRVHSVVRKKSATLRDRNGVDRCASEMASTPNTTAPDAKARPVKEKRGKDTESVKETIQEGKDRSRGSARWMTRRAI